VIIKIGVFEGRAIAVYKKLRGDYDAEKSGDTQVYCPYATV
jgi:hypothetical protein